jgi:ubiquitin-protein ligase
MDLITVANYVMLLLEEPNADSPLNSDAAREYRSGQVAWKKALLAKYNVDCASICPSSKPKDHDWEDLVEQY